MRLWVSINKSTRHVFVLGSADGGVRQSLLSMIAMLARDDGHAVTVFCDGFAKADVEECAPEVECIVLCDIMEVAAVSRQAIVLGRALMEVRPATIRITSSEVGWTMFGLMAAALAECSMLYAELPDLVAWSDGGALMVAERFVATGVSGFVKLIAPSAEAATRWVVRYGVECGVAGSSGVPEIRLGACESGGREILRNDG